MMASVLVSFFLHRAWAGVVRGSIQETPPSGHHFQGQVGERFWRNVDMLYFMTSVFSASGFGEQTVPASSVVAEPGPALVLSPGP